jgi:ubiquitin thioesterase protein OTUB1
MVEDLFNAAGWSDYIVSWCRLYLSAFLRQNAEEFAPFLPEPYYSVETFCVNEVEPTGREGDHLQLSALTQAIPCVRVHVEYVDASSAKMVAYDFESRSVDPAFDGLAVNLLYRPGHYDVLYSATSG